VLSNPQRRKEYDIARRSAQKRQSWSTSATAQEHAEPETVFGGVFEELLRPEVENPTSFYSPVGMASGAALGFICGGIPGAILVCAPVLLRTIKAEGYMRVSMLCCCCISRFIPVSPVVVFCVVGRDLMLFSASLVDICMRYWYPIDTLLINHSSKYHMSIGRIWWKDIRPYQRSKGRQCD
jgi:hypothetical protein